MKNMILQQEKVIELLDFRILNTENYKKVVDYATKSSEFKEIDLSKVSFYKSKNKAAIS